MINQPQAISWEIPLDLAMVLLMMLCKLTLSLLTRKYMDGFLTLTTSEGWKGVSEKANHWKGKSQEVMYARQQQINQSHDFECI